MKYLVVYAGNGSEEKTLCDDQKQAVELLEGRLRDGCAETEFQVYTTEPISFSVERVPVVTLGAEAAETADAAAPQPEASDFPSASYSSYTDDNKGEDADPFTTEQVFSLDS